MIKPNPRLIYQKWSEVSLEGKRLFAFFMVVFSIGIFFSLVLSAPSNFPTHAIVRVEEGSTLSGVSADLYNRSFIKSEIAFKVFVYLLGDKGVIFAGDYFFDKPPTVMTVAKRIVTGEQNLIPDRVTIQEGLNKFQISSLLAQKFQFFDEEEFEKYAEEGYLFPDTYFFLPNITALDVALRVRNNFENQIEELLPDIAESGHSLEEIITMASIIEKEANTKESRRVVSGILWKRIEIGMALQVDATFSYVNGKNTYTLSLEDLTEESPYNTYINTGLPPGPISNPGIDSIRAAIHPTETDYLYFLHDLSGNIYYAEDFDGHQFNRERYLRR